VPPPMNSRG